MDSDGSPQKSVQCNIHGVPTPIGCTALNTRKEVRDNEQKRKPPHGAADRTAGCPS